jgi:DeoR/GlpR family transcriptional regulator of sugar metabolism
MSTFKDLLPHERQSIILARLNTQGRVLAAQLAEEMAVSEDSIRRDLRDLAQRGLCRRVYGGALSLAPTPAPLTERIGAPAPALHALASAAAAIVQRGQTLFLDAGSTNLAIAQALPGDLDLTVVTNAPGIAAALFNQPGIATVLIGGRVDARSGACIGAKALRDAQAIHCDLYFMGTCALEIDAGITAFDYEEAEFKRALVAGSNALVVPLLAVKFDTVAPYRVVDCSDIDHLVIESDSRTEPLLDELRQLGCQVHAV